LRGGIPKKIVRYSPKIKHFASPKFIGLATLMIRCLCNCLNPTDFLKIFGDGRPKSELFFLPGRLRWALLPKKCYSNSLSGCGSTTQPPIERRTLYHWSVAAHKSHFASVWKCKKSYVWEITKRQRKHKTCTKCNC